MAELVGGKSLTRFRITFDTVGILGQSQILVAKITQLLKNHFRFGI